MKNRVRSTTLLIVCVFIFSLLTYYPTSAKASRTYYVHKTSKLYSTSGSSKQVMGFIPINAQLKTASKTKSKMYKVVYAGQTGYVYKSNLWTRRTTVTRYIKKTSYLYTSSNAAKQRVQKIAINKSLTTDSSLGNKMYHVNYKGKRGYVYAVNLSTKKTPITKYVIKASKRYKNYAHTKNYKGNIPVNTVLTTTSPQSNKLYWVNYNGVNCYVYASNLASQPLNYSYDNSIPSNTYGVVSVGGNHGIWDQPYGIAGAKSVGRIADYERLPLNILRESKVGSTVWFQIGVDGQTLGWIHKDTVQVTSEAAEDGSIPHVAVANVHNTNGQLYAKVNDSPLPVFLNIYANLKLKIDQIADNGRWVHIKKYTAGTSLGWVKSDDLTIQEANASGLINVNYNATISSSTAPIFDDQSSFVGYSGQYNADNRVVQINEEKQVENEEMYRISYNHHVIGWVRSNAMNLVNPTKAYMQARDLNTTFGIYNGQSNGDAPDSNARIGNLSNYSRRMLEVTKTWNDWSFIKYNDWFGQADKDIDIGWVNNASLGELQTRTDDFQYHMQTGNASDGKQQGLAYDSKRDYYYVGYDLGNGLGKIAAYDRGGKKVNESGSMTLGHACALSYNPYNDQLYEVSSAGDAPTIYTIDPDSLEMTGPKKGSETGISLDTNRIPYVAMMAVRDQDTLILLTESFGDDSFFTYNLKTGKLSERHSMQKMGIVQGMQYEDGKLYFLANNYLTVLNDNWTIADRFHFSIPNGGTPQESEGLTMMDGKLVIGFADHHLYIEK
ncbi:MAG: GW domain-containing glycosaminoglycan-binding protein [Sporolactobacillus sp.]